jgi:hypothetical protein
MRCYFVGWKTVAGRERRSVNVRYPRDFRSDQRAIASDILAPTMRGGGMLPLGQLADMRLTQGATTCPCHVQDLTRAQSGNRRRPADKAEGFWKAEANSGDRDDQHQDSQCGTSN